MPFALAAGCAALPSSIIPSWRLYPDKKVRDAATDYLLREAEITGADAFAIGHELPQAVNGVENPNFYQVNRDLFRQSLDGRTQLVQALEGIAADLDTLQRSLFSREVKTFEMEQRAYRDGRETPEAWISHVLAYPQARTLDLKKNFLFSRAVLISGLLRGGSAGRQDFPVPDANRERSCPRRKKSICAFSPRARAQRLITATCAK